MSLNVARSLIILRPLPPSTRTALSLTCAVLLSACAAPQLFSSPEAERTFRTHERALRAQLPQIAIAQSAAGGDGLLVAVSTGTAGPAQMRIIGPGPSPAAVIWNQTTSGEWSCPRDETLFFVPEQTAARPVDTVNCLAVLAQVIESRKRIDELTRLMASTDALSKELSSTSDALSSAVASDLRLTLLQHAQIKQQGRMIDNAQARTASVANKLKEVSAQTEAMNKSTMAFMDELKKKLADLEAQLKRF